MNLNLCIRTHIKDFLKGGVYFAVSGLLIVLSALYWSDEVCAAEGMSYITVELNDMTAELTLAEEEYQMYPEVRDFESMSMNTQHLQAVIDAVSDVGGGTVTIPAGNYYFSPLERNFNTKESVLDSSDVNYIEYHVIRCRDNVTTNGTLQEDGSLATTLYPVASLPYPIDMFYYGDLFEYSNDRYLVNADFNNFIIDGSYAVNTGHYNAKGKGFYILLFRDCDWNNIIVMNTDGTGFGMDCPINSTVSNCTAIGCGKQATTSDVGASGFGIGFGYSTGESIWLNNCLAIGNRKFGIFFENQARFSTVFQAGSSSGFVAENCISRGNLYDFGGEMCSNTVFVNCVSEDLYASDPNPLKSVNKLAYFFGTNSRDYHIIQNGAEISVYSANKKYYKDVHDWFVSEGWFDKVIDQGIMYGYTNESGEPTYVFGQDDYVTRGQIAVMLFRCIYPDKQWSNSAVNTTPFYDNVSNTFYTEAINWAYKNGIFTGDKNPDGSRKGTVRPEDGISREELATVLYRFAGKQGADIVNYDAASYSKAPDADKVSKWAVEGIGWCYSNNIMNGGAIDGRLSPADIATRGHAGKMIVQTLSTFQQ